MAYIIVIAGSMSFIVLATAAATGRAGGPFNHILIPHGMSLAGLYFGALQRRTVRPEFWVTPISRHTGLLLLSLVLSTAMAAWHLYRCLVAEQD